MSAEAATVSREGAGPFSGFERMVAWRYLRARRKEAVISVIASISFAGIMLGITFHMLNGLFSNLGIINSWPPFFSAITPSALFLLAAAGMLWWVERR